MQWVSSSHHSGASSRRREEKVDGRTVGTTLKTLVIEVLSIDGLSIIPTEFVGESDFATGGAKYSVETVNDLVPINNSMHLNIVYGFLGPPQTERWNPAIQSHRGPIIGILDQMLQTLEQKPLE
jgi:hypothetical protein